MGDSENYTASRQSAGDTSYSSLTPQYEERLIILVQGKQFQNDSLGDYAIPKYLSDRLPSLVVTDDANMTYSDDTQHVNFTIKRVTKKSDFVAALSNQGAHVVYAGHARFGQGPCFGDGDGPGEDWGSNTQDTTLSGVFRMGFPYIGLPIDEIADEHQYTVSPVSGNDPQPAASDCHPHARSVYGQMKQISVTDLASKTQAGSTQVAAFLGNAGQDDTFWGYDATGESGKFERHVLCKCDWQNTDITPMDLGAATLSCRAFICIACSTFIHNYPVVRKLKGWAKDKANNTNYAYWTTHVTFSGPMAAFWLYRILTYPKRNDNQSWEPSLEYAKQMANKDYVGIGPKSPSSLY
jgi:hypothetical protein